MTKLPKPIPVFDLHCDLLSYLAHAPHGSPMNEDDIGAAIPHLQRGNVKLQVMAIYTSSTTPNADFGLRQSKIFKNLLSEYSDVLEAPDFANGVVDVPAGDKIKIIAAIENASGFCGEDDHLDSGFRNLETIINTVGRILYIGITHWSENRFGGGNDCHTGLKEDGKILLDYLDGRRIAVDFSHSSDELALDILNYIEKKNLDIPVIASHSNYREVHHHERNLPKELAREIIRREGLIGMNFLQPFVHDKNPEALVDHILYGLNLDGERSIAFGADFFYEAMALPSTEFEIFFFDEHCNASKFPAILETLSRHLPVEDIQNISHLNVLRYIQNLWSFD